MNRDVLTSMTVSLGTKNSKFSGAVNAEGDISVAGTVKAGHPFLTNVGNFDVDILIEVRSCMSRSSLVMHVKHLTF